MPLRIFKKITLAFIILFSTHNLQAQNYKLVKAKDSINTKAIVLIKEAFSKKDVSSLFDKTFICGPNLWKFISTSKRDTLIEGLEANFQIMQPDVSYKTAKGKIIQTLSNANKVWLDVIGNSTNLRVRRLTNEELVMYASLLSPTIKEPIYIATINKNNYLIHIDNRNLKMMVIEKLN